MKNGIFYFCVIFRTAASTRKRFCLFFFGEGNKEKKKDGFSWCSTMQMHSEVLRVKRNVVCRF